MRALRCHVIRCDGSLPNHPNQTATKSDAVAQDTKKLPHASAAGSILGNEPRAYRTIIGWDASARAQEIFPHPAQQGLVVLPLGEYPAIVRSHHGTPGQIAEPWGMPGHMPGEASLRSAPLIHSPVPLSVSC